MAIKEGTLVIRITKQVLFLDNMHACELASKVRRMLISNLNFILFLEIRDFLSAFVPLDN